MRHTGTVVEVTPAARRANVDRMVTLKLDSGERSPKVNDKVELRTLLTDEEIGRRFRLMLTKNIERSTVRDFATDIADSLGWPVLADLVRDVIDGEDDES